MKHHGAPSIKLPPRHYEVGAETQLGCGVHFRVWAPRKGRIAVVLCDEQKRSLAEFVLEQQERGYFAGWVAEAKASTLYGYRVGDRPEIVPDPASRFQPFGPAGPSQVIDPGQFSWSDAQWRGVGREGQVIYEMHFGTFTPEGTYAAAAEQLGELARLPRPQQPRLLSGHDGPLAPGPGNTDALSRSRVCLLAAVSFLRRSQPGARPPDSCQPCEIPRPISRFAFGRGPALSG